MANIRIPKDYEKKTYKSVHNRSCIRRTTAHAGLMIPIYSRRVMAGEKVFIDPTTVVQTNALQAPLMGSFTLQLAVFFDSDSNYYGWMDNNAKLTTQEYLNRRRHQIYFSGIASPLDAGSTTYQNWLAGTEGASIRKHSIHEYAGIPQFFSPISGENDEHSIDLGFYFTYLNIFRNYYCNNQETQFPFVSQLSENFNKDPFGYADLTVLDKLFKELRFQDDGFDFSVPTIPATYPGMKWFRDNYLYALIGSFSGLIPTTYKPDLFTNLLNRSSNVKSYVRVTTTGSEANSFTIDTLRFQNKLQRLIDRLDVSGGRFSNWLRAVWGVKTRKDMDIPEMIGVTQKLIDPTELSAKSNSAAVGDQPAKYLGDLGGNFNKIDGHRGHSFYANTSGRVMVIATIVPNVDYCQGMDYEITKVNFADDYTPEFAQLGFQNVPMSRYSALPHFESDGTGDLVASIADPFTESVGKQVAWLEEMTDVNRNFGEFGWNGLYSYWVLNRNFSRLKDFGSGLGKVFEPTITQYINPLDYQYPFIAQSIADPNWFIQCGFKIKSVRPIGKRYMPNLE